MSTAARKRLIVELVATAFASPVLIFGLGRLGEWRILWLLGWPLVVLSSTVMKWINPANALQGPIDLWSAFLLLCILVWMILFGIVRLFERLIKRKKRDTCN
jgi:hypothetical protein